MKRKGATIFRTPPTVSLFIVFREDTLKSLKQFESTPNLGSSPNNENQPPIMTNLKALKLPKNLKSASQPVVVSDITQVHRFRMILV
jgi:hypothetical protein